MKKYFFYHYCPAKSKRMAVRLDFIDDPYVSPSMRGRRGRIFKTSIKSGLQIFIHDFSRTTMIFYILLFQAAFLFAGEKIINGKVLDENRKPVAYASIGIVGTSYGTVSGPDGNFIFYLPQGISESDSLKISCIGYASEKFPAAALTESITITLNSETHQLQEVTIRSVPVKTKIIGNKREDTFLNCNFTIGKKPNQNLGCEIGRKFFFKGKKHYLRTLNVYCAYNFDTVMLRMNIYSLKNGLPYENLLKENIILNLIKPQRGWVNFDLRAHDLAFDQNIIVSLEWIGHSKRGRDFQMPITVPAPGSVHFYKFGSQNKWKRYNNMSTSINLEVGVEEK